MTENIKKCEKCDHYRKERDIKCGKMYTIEDAVSIFHSPICIYDPSLIDAFEKRNK